VIDQKKGLGRVTCIRLVLLSFALITCLWLGVACQSSGESHFGTTKSLFRVCTDGLCESGDSCACAVCTVPCRDISDCAERILGPGKTAEDLKGDVVCQAPACFAEGSAESDDAPGAGAVCEVLCQEDEDCDFITESSGTHTCVSGYCRSREEPADLEPAEIVGPACRDGQILVPQELLDSGVGLCVDAEEVTVAEFRTCVDAGDCTAPIAGNYLTSMRENHPVHYLETRDAEAYCAFIGGRLPTRLEWEAAGRGETPEGEYPFGAAAPALGDTPQKVCAFEETTTCEVGSFAAGDGPLGHADLSGNVSEIVVDGEEFCAAGGHYESNAEGLTLSSCEPSPIASATVGFRCVSDL
jgi:Sulfatase-modifying factor enzyme 1